MKMMKDIFLKLMFKCPKNLHNRHNGFPFLPKGMKNENSKSL